MFENLPLSFGAEVGSDNMLFGISVRSDLLSVFSCHLICPCFENSQLRKTFVAAGCGALFTTAT